MKNETETLTKEISIEQLLDINDSEIVLYNDDVNTFDHVIESLVKICKHNLLQAEQCALIVHNNGKCTVKTGTYSELKDICTQLLNVELNAEII